jgi:hypothetical protein
VISGLQPENDVTQSEHTFAEALWSLSLPCTCTARRSALTKFELILACRLLGVANDVGMYIDAHQRLLEMDWTHLVAGHLDRTGSRGDVETQIEYINDLIAASSNALAVTPLAETLSDIPPQFLNNAWLVFSMYQRRVFDACYNEVVAKWGTRLGAADVYGRSHCEVMSTYVNIEGNV